MVRPRITNSLKGSLGELYYKEFCDQRGWAYVSLENLYSTLNDEWVFTFKKGFNRIKVKIPEELRSEVRTITRPTNNSTENPSFVFDFLACKVGTSEKYSLINKPKELCWVEIKTGKGLFSENQISAMFKITLQLAIFQIDDVLVPPSEITMDCNIKFGKEWLDNFEPTEESIKMGSQSVQNGRWLS